MLTGTIQHPPFPRARSGSILDDAPLLSSLSGTQAKAAAAAAALEQGERLAAALNAQREGAARARRARATAPPERIRLLAAMS